jgi:hypothetical protein
MLTVVVFSFDIEDVFDLGGSHNGITLVGPPAETSGGLGSGDTLLVPARNGGQARCECVEFPLVNLGPDPVAWVRVSVTGVSPDDVRIGSRATRAS